jgi:hypothetical protein
VPEGLDDFGARWLFARVDGGLSQGVAAHAGEQVLIAIPDPVRISPLSCSGSSFSPAACRFSSRMICCMPPQSPE